MKPTNSVKSDVSNAAQNSTDVISMSHRSPNLWRKLEHKNPIKVIRTSFTLIAVNVNNKKCKKATQCETRNREKKRIEWQHD